MFISKHAQMSATLHILQHSYSNNNASVLDPSNFSAASCIRVLQNKPILGSGLHIVKERINKLLLIT